MKNKLIVIGETPEMGVNIKSCYLNISKDEAIKRFLNNPRNRFINRDDLFKRKMISEFEFDDEFESYQAFPKQ